MRKVYGEDERKVIVRKKFIGDRKFYMMGSGCGCSDHDSEWNYEFREFAG